ncbi:MAG: aminotransferase class IV [Planctomycetota bacterium]|nr:aminotransferase class IV [Planctomycetota bacterium]
MHEPLAYLNGQFLPQSQASVSVTDMGFVLGTTVTEQLRTFGGRLFHLTDHLERLQRSLKMVGVVPKESLEDLALIAERLVDGNLQSLAVGDDLGLAMFVTPGLFPALNDGQGGDACTGLHTYRLPLASWADKYETGQSLVVTDVEQVPRRCWPAELKCRSRMHYYLADQAAERTEPGARALMLDAEGFVMEASTANIVLHDSDKGLLAPPHDSVLPGISLAVVRKLADRLGISWTEQPLRVEDVERADEILLSSTPFCLLPVTRFNGRDVNGAIPGGVFRKLIAAWSAEVGVEIVAQAKQFAVH